VGSRPNRVIAAVELLKAEAFELEQQFNHRYPVLVQEGRITNLLGMSHRIRLLRHIANQIESI
jgi:hypothetical protein